MAGLRQARFDRDFVIVGHWIIRLPRSDKFIIKGFILTPLMPYSCNSFGKQ
jgi:hypothetical protein